MSNKICGFMVEKNIHLNGGVFENMRVSEVLDALLMDNGIHPCGELVEPSEHEEIRFKDVIWTMTLFNGNGVNNTEAILIASSFRKLMKGFEAIRLQMPARFDFEKSVVPTINFTGRNLDFMTRNHPYMKFSFNEFRLFNEHLADAFDDRHVNEKDFLSRMDYHTCVATDRLWSIRFGTPLQAPGSLTRHSANVEPLVEVLLNHHKALD